MGKSVKMTAFQNITKIIIFFLSPQLRNDYSAGQNIDIEIHSSWLTILSLKGM